MSGGTHELKGKSVEVKTAAPRDGPRPFNGGGGYNGGGGGGGYGGQGGGGGGGGYGGQQGWSQQVWIFAVVFFVYSRKKTVCDLPEHECYDIRIVQHDPATLIIILSLYAKMRVQL